MMIGDYDGVMELLRGTPGVSLREADSREATARYLDRNPGLSFVAEAEGRIVGCVFSGHDGRRGYLQHLAVEPAWRRQGIGGRLWNAALDRLEVLGIRKIHLDVLVSNPAAAGYWARAGWSERTDLRRYSIIRSGNAEA